MNEEACDFIKAVEHERVPPHCYRDCIISKSKTERADEKPFWLWEDPYTEKDHEVDEITKIGQEVVVSDFSVGEVANRHEIQKLNCIPDVEVFRIATNQISTDQDI